jgi:Lrp/AsnC family transcriptional regulator, regulator for asnA, asnC and gidA
MGGFMSKAPKKKAAILDGLDQKIIQELQRDGRESYLDIGHKVHASEGTVRNRVSLAIAKELMSLKAVLNPDKLGFTFSCIMGLEVSIDCLDDAAAALAESPNVYFLSGCTGTFDLIAIMVFRNTVEFDKFTRNIIARLPGIKRSQTFVNMRIIKNPWTNDVDIARLVET